MRTLKEKDSLFYCLHCSGSFKYLHYDNKGFSCPSCLKPLVFEEKTIERRQSKPYVYDVTLERLVKVSKVNKFHFFAEREDFYFSSGQIRPLYKCTKSFQTKPKVLQVNRLSECTDFLYPSLPPVEIEEKKEEEVAVSLKDNREKEGLGQPLEAKVTEGEGDKDPKKKKFFYFG